MRRVHLIRLPDVHFDTPDRDVHLTARTTSRDPRRHRFDAVVAAFIAACQAEAVSERTIEFYLEGLSSYRAFAGADNRELTLADLDLGVARTWLVDFVERGRKPAMVAARARALDAALRRYLTRERSRAVVTSDLPNRRVNAGQAGDFRLCKL